MRGVGRIAAGAVIAGVLAVVLVVHSGTADPNGGVPPDVLRDWAGTGILVLVVSLAVSGLAWWFTRPWLTVGAALTGFAAGGATVAADTAARALDTPLRAVLDAEYGGFDLRRWTAAPRHDPIAARLRLDADARAPADEGGVVSMPAEVLALRVRGAWVPARGRVALAVGGRVAPARLDAWVRGRTLEAPLVFRRPERYANDGVPDFERAAALGGVVLLASAKSGLLVEVLEHGSALDEWAARVRRTTRRAVATWVAAPDAPPAAAGASPRAIAAGIVTAVLIGDRAGIPDDVRTRMQAAGTYHVIAISGSNIALFAAMAVAVPVLLGAGGRRAAWLSIAALAAYAQVVTAGPSVWRAMLMAVLHLAAIGLDHRAPSPHVIGVAAAVMVLVRPFDVLDPGFLLTFGATAALVAVVGRWPAPGAAGRIVSAPVLRWIATAVAATCAIDVVLLPVAAYAFGAVTVAGIVLNLVALPLMAVVQVAGLAVVAADALGLPASWPGWIAGTSAHALVESARLVDVVPWTFRPVSPPAPWIVLVYYAACVGVVAGRGRMRGVSAALLAVAAATVWVGAPSATRSARSPDELRLTMFDVGQGESLLVETPDGGTLMVDTGGRPFGGGRFDVGRLVLAPALLARGVPHLDRLLLTHGDPDHVGGARALLDRFPVGALVHGVRVPGHPPSEALVETAAAAGVPVEAWRQGRAWAADGVRLRVLHPPPPDWERRRVRNDDSVVVELVYGGVAILLTGDIGADVERAILPRLTDARTRVLKVAHHGSRTSTSRPLLEGWRPQVALISAGRGNPFGHPAREVVERLDATGAVVYRTDRDGQITLSTDGRTVRVQTRLDAR